MSKSYDYKALIDIYISIPLNVAAHPIFRTYKEELVEKLEALMEVGLDPDRRLSTDNVHWELWTLFDDAVRFVRSGPPGTGYQEGGPSFTLSMMAIDGDQQAGRVRKQMTEARDLFLQARDAHRELLYGLFELIYGKIDTVITSEDLKKHGFDDSKEPNIKDYWDWV